jgi:hypothetical protein
MRKECLGSLAVLITGASFCLAQEPRTLPFAIPAGQLLPTPTVEAPTELPPLPVRRVSDVSDSPTPFPYPGTGVYSSPSCPGCEPDPVETDAGPVPGKHQRHWYDGEEPLRATKVADLHPHVWGSAEAVLWWVKSGPSPVLAMSNAAPLFGDHGLDYGSIPGGRFSFGVCNTPGTFGIEGTLVYLGQTGVNFTTASGADGTPAITRPITLGSEGAPNAFSVSSPGIASGRLSVDSSTMFWDGEFNLLGHLCGGECLSFDMIGGFRYVDLEEDLKQFQHTTFLGTGLLPPVGGPQGSFTMSDVYRTRNQFFGAQLGSQMELRWRRLYTNLLGKVAMGSIHQVVEARGETAITTPLGATTIPGGLYASSTSGRRTFDDFAVIPELNFNVGVQLTPAVRVFAGYSFLYMSDVVRPGDQIGSAVNATLFPGLPGAGPAGTAVMPFTRSDFWAQGVNFGMALRW